MIHISQFADTLEFSREPDQCRAEFPKGYLPKPDELATRGVVATDSSAINRLFASEFSGSGDPVKCDRLHAAAEE